MRDNCPICQSEKKSVLKHLKMTIPPYFHLPSEYDIVVCEECGFCYAATDATMEDYDYYYSHCNSYSGTPNESMAKAEFNQKVVELIGTLADKNAMMLDMGYGKGNLMRLLKKRGFHNIYGIDPSIDSILQMQKEGFRVYQGSIFNEIKQELKGKFDFVFLFDVLEHLLYPDKAIENISGYLKENGRLLVGVPNYATLFDDDSILVNQFNQEHINYFSPISLNNLLKSKDFYSGNYDEISQAEISDPSGILIVARYGGRAKGGGKTSYLRDEISRKSITSYLGKNDRLAEMCDEKLSNFMKATGSPIYVWGTGAYVMWLLSNTALGGGKIKIEAFVDNNPTKIGKGLMERPIISPQKLNKNFPIVICSMRYSREIAAQIQATDMVNPYMIL